VLTGGDVAKPWERAWSIFFRMEPWPVDGEKVGKETLFCFPFGLGVAISFGQMVWPWSRDWSNKNARVFRSFIPLPGIFLSFKARKGWGFYIGCKAFDVSSESPRCQWADLEREDGNRYLCFSVSIRRTADA